MQNKGYYGVPFRSYRSLLFKFRSNAVTLTKNFRYKGLPPTNHFCTDSSANKCLTTLSLIVFTQVLRLRRYERKSSKNRRFRTNAVTLIQNFRYKGSPPPIILARLVRPMNALQLCLWQVSHRCYGWGATSKNRAKIDDFAPTRSLCDPKFQVQGVAPHQSFLNG